MNSLDESKRTFRPGLHPIEADCPPGTEPLVLSDEYKKNVCEALRSAPDIWGREVLARPEGPTFDNVKDYMKPIMYAVNGVHKGSFLTDTGVYYIPFGQPNTLTGLGDVALTVADGSQIISNREGQLSTRFYVGASGQELFGSCLANLSTPRLYKEYLPILELDYRDAEGGKYHQESFAACLPGSESLASFVEITAERGQSSNESAVIRIRVCDGIDLRQEGNRLVDGQGRTYAIFSPGGALSGTVLSYELDFSRQGTHSVYFIRPVTPVEAVPELQADKETHRKIRSVCTNYWESRLAEGLLFHVPEDLVMDAQRNLLCQDLLMTWRYSLGNAYQAFYQPESSSTIALLGRYGHTAVHKQALKDLLSKSKAPNRRCWEMGEKLSHAADYYRLTGDGSLIMEHLDTYISYADDLIAQHEKDPNHLLERQQYSSDVKDMVYGVHQNGLAVYGLQSIVSVWKELGLHELAEKYGPAAKAFRAAYDEAVKKSNVTLPDGTLFTPVFLLDTEEPYQHVAATFLGSYWNLVVHYAFAAHVYAPGSPEAKATIRYLYEHGAFLLGQLKVRDGAINDVYAVELAKFLADNDEPDQLVLSFYGHLAHGLSRNTLIAGEACSVGPLASKWPGQFGHEHEGPHPSFEEGWQEGEYFRGMFLSPNSANNGYCLQLLRLMLVNEVTNDKGEPQSLQLGFATPRSWLEDGKRIQVYEAPTLFGPISYTIKSELNRNQVSVELEVPGRAPIGSIALRLRVPAGKSLIGVNVNGQPYDKFEEETIDLTGCTGRVNIIANFV